MRKHTFTKTTRRWTERDGYRWRTWRVEDDVLWEIEHPASEWHMRGWTVSEQDALARMAYWRAVRDTERDHD